MIRGGIPISMNLSNSFKIKTENLKSLLGFLHGNIQPQLFREGNLEKNLLVIAFVEEAIPSQVIFGRWDKILA